MTQLITLEEAKAHLRVDHNLDDDDIDAAITEASAAVLAYIGDSQYLFLDTSGDEIDLEDTSADQAGLRAQSTCKRATKILVGSFYRYRDGGSPDVRVDAKFGYGYLPAAVTALLYPLRDPTIA